MLTIQSFALFALLAISAPAVDAVLTLSPDEGKAGFESYSRMNDPSDAVDLGEAGDFAILTSTGISKGLATTVRGDIAVSPISLSAITGFALTLDSAVPAQFATSESVLHLDDSTMLAEVFAADMGGDTATMLTEAVSNMGAAYDDASGRVDPTIVSNLELAGLVIMPGLYKFGGAVGLTGSVTLKGGADDVIILQIPGAFSTAAASQVILAGDIDPKNVFWQIAGAISIGASTHLEGVFLGKTSMAFGASASLNGAVLCQTAVTMGADVAVVKMSESTI